MEVLDIDGAKDIKKTTDKVVFLCIFSIVWVKIILMKNIEKVKLVGLLILIAVLLFFMGAVAMVKIQYPLGYNDLIVYYSKEYELDPNLVRAIIKEESGYNIKAKSDVGAMGLMQIMPQTAIWIAQELEDVNFKVEDLYEPETNIKMGCFYLNYLFSKYGDDYKVLFAYNAGEGRLNSFFPEEFVLENITIEETKNYINRVIKSKNRYESLIEITKKSSINKSDRGFIF